MNQRFRTLTGVILASYMCFGTDGYASDADTNHFTLHLPTTSATAAYFLNDPDMAVSLLNRVAEKTLPYLTSNTPKKSNRSANDYVVVEFDQAMTSPLSQAMAKNPLGIMKVIEASLSKAEPLEAMAALGSFKAMRRLAQKAENKETKLKWVFVELLTSLGESVNFEGLVKAQDRQQANQPKRTLAALEAAAVWIHGTYYGAHDVKATYGKINPSTFAAKAQDAYDSHLKAGNTVDFFQAVTFCPYNARSHYLEFFLHLGIQDTNVEQALTSLQKSSQNQFPAAKELEAFMSFAKQLTNKPLRHLENTTKKSQRLQWSAIQDGTVTIEGVDESVALFGRTMNFDAK